jgi:glycosyltransferase involved in cell wall biosynthesis
LKTALYIIGCNGIPARYGGFETFAEYLSKELAGEYAITIACSTNSYSAQEQHVKWGNIERKFFHFKGNGIQSLIYDYYSLRVAAKKADHILVLGVGPGLFMPLFPKLRNKKVYIHVDGLDWKRKKWSLFSKLLLKIGFSLSIRSAFVIIIDNVALYNYIPLRYQLKVKLITYGGDHLIRVQNTVSPLSTPYALVIARAEPENNLSLIIKAFKSNKSHYLILISNWNQTAYGKRLLKKYSHHSRLLLIGPLYDIIDLQRYRNHCKVYIHGHSAGGTNPSLVEAMYSGKPIIAWDNEFNRTSTNNLSMYFKNEKELSNHLTKMDNLEGEVMGFQLKEYAQANYRWSIVADKFRAMLKDD